MRKVLFFGHHGREGDEIRNDGDNVYNVHDVAEEVHFARAGEKPHGQLESEPHYTYSLYEEERVCYVGNFVFFDLGAVGRGVEDLVVFEFGKGFEAEDDDGQEDDEYGDDGHNAGSLRAFGVFE